MSEETTAAAVGFDRGRRQLLVGVALVGAGLYIGVNVKSAPARLPPASHEPFAPNAFIRIAEDDTVTIISPKAEMGQGVYTSLPMIIAEELGVDPSRIRVEAAPVDPAYNSNWFPMQFTGGSSSVRTSFEPLRAAGAAARAVLIAAAAKAWQIDPARLSAADGVITDGTRRARYGELVPLTAGIQPPAKLPLKPASEFKVIGRRVPRLDSRVKVTGQAEFGIDVRQPQMLYAMIARAPVFGARLTGVDDTATRAIAGVVDVKSVPSGVAVIATNTWAAKRGREALQTRWDEGAGAELATRALREEYRALVAKPGLVAHASGDVSQALAHAAHVIEAEYEVPYLAHACMEPLNCTVHARADRCDIWVGTQFQSEDRRQAAAALGLKPEQVALHTTFLGGGFGRRGNAKSDFIVEAVHVARDLGRPVKVQWTREDDMRGGWYRPFFLDRLRGGLDRHGMPVAWHQTMAGQSIIAGTLFEPIMKKTFDVTSVEGAADMPYAIEHLTVDIHEPVNAVPVQFWRSVGHSHTGFVVNGFLDELAAAGRKDPLELRRALLAGKPRHLAVLNAAAEHAGWGKPLPQGHAHGIALQESFGSIVAQVAEVSVMGEAVRVHRVVCAVDCGPVVNPDTVAAQMEGGIVYGLSAALHGAITLDHGRVQQNNFNDYPVLRMNEMPAVETHIIASDGPMGGVGEIAVPVIAPAVCNAIFTASGRRIRRLPITASLA
ncbi:MAG TPA: xanthine dehydrogenase family protein molybdopterin-binding subunit [Steroidobacteraceae bacterium]|nr:xanthine dehydrogenase family protein molybdopterin-binding subunit [Steroidobacteraceae bacterium]